MKPQWFVELARALVFKSGYKEKHVVVSRRDDGLYSIAQLVTSFEGDKAYGVFLQNAIITDVPGLIEVVEALQKVLESENLVKSLS